MEINPSSSAGSSNLDLLRSLAVLMVLFDHLVRHFYYDQLAGVQLTNIGVFGVLLFFVHTSLVLMQSMQRSKLSGTPLIKHFYVRRFFRIYPLAIVTVLVAVALHLHANGRGLAFGPRPGWAELASNLLLIQNLTKSASVVGPLWSLPLEVQMYLLLPFLFLWRKRSVTFLLVLWLFSGILGRLPETISSLRWFTLLIYVPNFLPGIIAFTLPEKKTIPGYLWPPFILLLTAAFLIVPLRPIGAGMCLLLGLTIPRFREIRFRPLKELSHYIAKYSYGIYLAHSFCIWFALTLHHSWLLFWTTWILIPIVLYYLVEKPGITLGARIADSFTKPAPRVPVVAPSSVIEG